MDREQCEKRPLAARGDPDRKPIAIAHLQRTEEIDVHTASIPRLTGSRPAARTLSPHSGRRLAEAAPDETGGTVMRGGRSIGIAAAAAAAAVALVAGGTAATSGGGGGAAPATTPDGSHAADMLRGEAMNAKYGLGSHAIENQDWYRALMVRSEALDGMHGLGRYAE